MSKLLPTFNTKWSEKLTITTKWRRLHEGGLDDIRAWHTETKASGKPIMVVIDVLAKVRKPAGNKHLYDADYEAVGMCMRWPTNSAWPSLQFTTQGRWQPMTLWKP